MRDVITRAFCVYRDFFARWYAIHKCSSAVAPIFNRNTQNSTHIFVQKEWTKKQSTTTTAFGTLYIKCCFSIVMAFLTVCVWIWVELTQNPNGCEREWAGANGHVQRVKLRWREMNQHHSVCIRCYPLCMYKSHWQTGCAFKVSQRVLKCRNAYQ